MKIALACGVAVTAGAGWLALRLYDSDRGERGGLRRGVATVWLASLVGVLLLSVLLDRSGETAPLVAGPAPAASLAQVRALVQASAGIAAVPPDLTPAPGWAMFIPKANFGGPPPSTGCAAGDQASSVPPCVFGVPRAPRTVVLYGDSHAQMWFQAFEDVATRDGWRFVILTKPSCPAALLAVHPLGQLGDYQACDRWHRFAVARINKIHPDLLVVTEETFAMPDGKMYTPDQWQRGLARLLDAVHAQRKVVLGNTPTTGGPTCLVRRHNVQACAGLPSARYNAAEKRAAIGARAAYVDVTPWFCTLTCSPVIGAMDVYYDYTHVAVGYTKFLERVLAQAVGF